MYNWTKYQKDLRNEYLCTFNAVFVPCFCSFKYFSCSGASLWVILEFPTVFNFHFSLNYSPQSTCWDTVCITRTVSLKNNKECDWTKRPDNALRRRLREMKSVDIVWKVTANSCWTSIITSSNQKNKICWFFFIFAHWNPLKNLQRFGGKTLKLAVSQIQRKRTT